MPLCFPRDDVAQARVPDGANCTPSVSEGVGPVGYLAFSYTTFYNLFKVMTL